MAKATQDGTYTLTPARRRALEVFARAARGEARESNATSPPAAVDAVTAMPTIYWQSRAWLEVEGLIEELPGRPSWYRLTAAGVGLVDQLGLREKGDVASAGWVDPPAPPGSGGHAEAQHEMGEDL